MSFLPGWQGVQALAAGSGIVTLSGASFTSFNVNATATAQLTIDDNGNVYQWTNQGGTLQLSEGTDWVRPAAAAPGFYEVRYTNLTPASAPLDSATAAEDVWHGLSSGDFILSQSRSGSGSDTSTFDIEIRLNGGPALASASYTLTATYILI